MKVHWSLALVVLVPPGVVTVMSTVPVPDGLVVRMSASDMMTNVPALVVPNATALAPVKPLPLMYTTVPGRPVFGPTAVTTGVGDAVYVYWSFVLVALVPPAVTTVTSTVPRACVGLIARMNVSLTTANPGPGVPPKLTAVAPRNPVPVMKVVDPIGPLPGLTVPTVGAGVGPYVN
jgi:hypothetical protein